MNIAAAAVTNANQALIGLLIKLGLLTSEQYKQHRPQSDYFPILDLAQGRMLDEGTAVGAVAKHLGIRVVDTDPGSVRERSALFDHPLLEGIPLTQWKSVRAIPIEISADHVIVALANPLLHDLVKSLSFRLGCKVHTVIASERYVLSVIGVKLGLQTEYNLDTIIDETQSIAAGNEHSKTRDTETSTLDLVPDSAPIVRLVNKIFSESIHQKASDIHITPEANALVVRIRVDGIMHHFFEVPKYLELHVITRIKILAGMDIAERRRPQDGRIRLKTADGIKDLRIATVPTIHGENLVARVLSAEFGSLTFPSLGMPAQIEKMLRSAISRSCQVVLVTGPTGSGKTSTLYAALLALRSPETHIITLEDPIEYRIEGINQIQVNEKTGLTFAASLRAVVRQDPDVIMIGEVRDSETASIAMQTAQTGHLVLATMHTNTAASAITRLLDLGVPAYLIASSVAGILAQRLARRLCRHCVQEATERELARLCELGIKPAAPLSAGGCEKCNRTGYSGRIGIYSFLPVTHEVSEKIRGNASEEQVELAAASAGFTNLADAAISLIEQGITSISEVERVLGPLEFILGKMNSGPTSETIREYHTSIRTSDNKIPIQPQRPKILLVEDDHSIAAVMRRVLEKEMFDVSLAKDGYEALQQIYHTCPDLIVCDLMMPELNGRDFIKKVRANPSTNDLPVLILTAADSQENEQDLIESGADDFVGKTSSPGIITARINRLLKQSARPR